MLALDAVFFALADPTRRAILARLALGEATVTELAEPFDMSQPAVSQHIKVLQDAGLISRRVDGAKRPCLLREEGMCAVEDWITQQRATWERRLDRMETYVSRLKKKERQNAGRKKRT